MLKILPAIDILDGNVVRLYKGRYDDVTKYSMSVKEQALEYKRLCVDRVHIVDLDGAKDGSLVNVEHVKDIVQVSNCSFEIEIGGGIRSIDSIKRYIDIGVNYIILGSKAVSDLTFLEEAIKQFGDKIIVGLDVKDGKPAVSGWTQTVEHDIKSLFKQFEKLGVARIIYTDISTDGTLSGVDIESIKHNLSLSSMKYIVSGGVASIKDIENLLTIDDDRLEGVIIGRALYDGRIDLAETLKLCGR